MPRQALWASLLNLIGFPLLFLDETPLITDHLVRGGFSPSGSPKTVIKSMASSKWSRSCDYVTTRETGVK